MINIFKVINFVKNQWLGFIILLLWIVAAVTASINANNDATKLYKIQNDIDKKKIIIDTLYKENVRVETRIKILKQKEYDTIRIIDTMSISELQEYFTNRYNKKDSIVRGSR
jgi:cell division protein FtsB